MSFLSEFILSKILINLFIKFSQPEYRNKLLFKQLTTPKQNSQSFSINCFNFSSSTFSNASSSNSFPFFKRVKIPSFVLIFLNDQTYPSSYHHTLLIQGQILKFYLYQDYTAKWYCNYYFPICPSIY